MITVFFVQWILSEALPGSHCVMLYMPKQLETGTGLEQTTTTPHWSAFYMPIKSFNFSLGKLIY